MVDKKTLEQIYGLLCAILYGTVEPIVVKKPLKKALNCVLYEMSNGFVEYTVASWKITQWYDQGALMYMELLVTPSGIRINHNALLHENWCLEQIISRRLGEDALNEFCSKFKKANDKFRESTFKRKMSPRMRDKIYLACA